LRLLVHLVSAVIVAAPRGHIVPISTEEAIYLIASAGEPVVAPDERSLPISRAEICRRILEWVELQQATEYWRLPARWDSTVPAPPLFDDDDDCPSSAFIRDVFGLVSVPGDADRVRTVGELVLYVEGRLCDLWYDYPGSCPSQQAFYALRQAVDADTGRRVFFRPRDPLREALPPERAESIRVVLGRRFGLSEVPVSRRLFGVAEVGATWLAIWPLSTLVCGLLLVFAGISTLGAFLLMLVWGIVLLELLDKAAQPAWDGLRTPADLVHMCLREREKAKCRVRIAAP
jgi:hypothetical protein